MDAIGTAALLAHQGGWDEMLMVAVPVAVFAALLYAANRRADRMDPTPTAPEGSIRSGRHRSPGDGDPGTTPRSSAPGRPAARPGQSSRSTSAPTEQNRSTNPS